MNSTISATPSCVFDNMTDPSLLSVWRSNIVRATVDGGEMRDGATGRLVRETFEIEMAFRFHVSSIRPPKSIDMLVFAGPVTLRTHTFLERASDAATTHIRHDISLSASGLFRLMEAPLAAFVLREERRDFARLKSWLDKLGADEL